MKEYIGLDVSMKFGLNNAHAIDFMLKHGGFSRHWLQGFL